MVVHLFKVVSGIDSLIVGEDQIIGQVKDAFQFAKEIQSTDKILDRLFSRLWRLGKRYVPVRKSAVGRLRQARLPLICATSVFLT